MGNYGGEVWCDRGGSFDKKFVLLLCGRSIIKWERVADLKNVGDMCRSEEK